MNNDDTIPVMQTPEDEKFELLMADCIRAEEAGIAIDRTALLAQHPDLANRLEEFFAMREGFQRIATPLSDKPIGRPFVPPMVRYFGDYELLDEIARGGMGVVYRARQTSLNRTVALKMILSGHLASEDDVKRFRSEAEAAASLQHPNIVAIHEVGKHGDHHYYSMDYVVGSTLAAITKETTLPARQAAQYVKQTADAVHFAHQEGVLHRDLKPSNVMIDQQGQVRITDFGLASKADGNSDLTRTGQILGTPSYMPPEQAQGKRSLIGAASDVYSLGAILYELLTGRPPFRAASVVETIQQVVSTEPASPRLLNRAVPRDLDTICLKCLEKEPHKRYGTAQILSEDLGRFLRGEPIHARAISRLARFERWCRRNPVIASLTCAAGLLLVAVASIATAAYLREAKLHENAERLTDEVQQAYGDVTQLRGQEHALRNEMRAAQETLSQAKKRTEVLETNYGELEKQRQTLASTLENRQQKLYLTLLSLAQADWEAGDVRRADAYLNDCPSHLRDRRWRRLKQLTHPEMREFTGVRCLAISPDGAQLASLRPMIKRPDEREPRPTRPKSIAEETEWEIVLSNYQTQQVVRVLPCRTVVNALAFSSDGKTLISAGADKIVRFWELETGEVRASLEKHTAPITSMSLAASGKLLATASYGQPKEGAPFGDVFIWDLETMAVLKKLPGLLTVGLNPAGTRVAFESRENRPSPTGPALQRVVRVEPLDSAGASDDETVFKVEKGAARCVFSPDGELLSLINDGYVEIWNVVDKQRVSQFHVYGIAGVAFSSDGARFAYAVRGDKKIRDRSADSVMIWNVHTGERERIIPWFESEVSDLAFTPDGTGLVTVDAQSVKVWDVTPSADPTESILADIRQLDVGPYDWPQWGGSRARVNTPSGKGIAADWNPGEFDRKTGEWLKSDARNIKWVAELGSQTYGNPVVANGKIFVGTNNGAGYLKRYPAEVDLGVLLCFEETTGEFLWQHSNEKLPTGRVHDWPLQGVCSTPAVDRDRLWYVTNRGHIVCLDTEGFRDGEDDGPDQSVFDTEFVVVANCDPSSGYGEAAPRNVFSAGGFQEQTIRSIFRNLGLPTPSGFYLERDGELQWIVKTTEPQAKVRRTLYQVAVEQGEIRVRSADPASAGKVILKLTADLTAGLNQGFVNPSLRAVFGARLPVDSKVTTIAADQSWQIAGTDESGTRDFRLTRSGALLVCEIEVADPGDQEADVVWRLDMIGHLGVSPHNMSNCSPLIVGDRLFVCTSNGVDEGHIILPAPDAPSFIALDRWTGEVLWTDKSPGLNILHAQWASPSYGVFDGQAQVIFPGGDGWVYSFDPAGDGQGNAKLLWKFDANFKDSRYEIGGRATRNDIIAFPAIYDGLVYIVTGHDPEYGEGVGCLWCIDPTRRTDGSDVSDELAVNARGEVIPHKRLQAVDPALGERAIPNPNSAAVWRYTTQDRNGDSVITFEETFHRSLSIPVIKDDVLYVSDFSGLFHCLNAKTGKVYWSYDLLAACWSSALLVDDKVFVGDEDGDVAIFRHSADPTKAMRMDGADQLPWYGVITMPNSIYMTPIVANNVLYIATKTHLFAISEE